MHVRIAVSWVLAAAIAWPVSSSAADARASVQALLGAIHELPSRKVFERAGGDETRALLTEFALDAELFPAYRHRALEALGYWPDDATWQLYVGLLTASETPDTTRHNLLRQLTRAFGERAVPKVEPYLDHLDPQLRMTATAALAEVPGAAVDARLLEAEKRAPTMDVRDHLRSINGFRAGAQLEIR